MRPYYTHRMVRVCIDERSENSFAGRIYGLMLEQPLAFQDASEFLLRLDESFDKAGFPQSFQEKRSFTEPLQPNYYRPADEKGRDFSRFIGEFGKYATYSLVISSRANASWQGEVLNQDFKRIGSFDSELDLFRLMYKKP